MQTEYVFYTKNKRLVYKKDAIHDIEAYPDAAYADCTYTMKSTIGWFCKKSGAALAWAVNRSSVVALSTTEAEYEALKEAVKEVLFEVQWFESLPEAWYKKKTVKVFEDNEGAINLTVNAVVNKRTKHFNVRWHFVRDVQQKGIVLYVHIKTADHPGDMMTKSLPFEKVSKFRPMMGVTEV